MARAPRTESLALAADASRIQAVLLALVDGQRSIDELVRIVVEQGLLPAPQASSAIRGLLERLHRSGETCERSKRRPGGFVKRPSLSIEAAR